MPQDEVKLSDALNWLYHELVHIRRIHFALIIVSLITIIITWLGQSVVDDQHLELKKLFKYVRKLSSESDLRDLFSHNIQAYIPQGIPHPSIFLSLIPKNQLIQFFPEKLIDPGNRNLGEIRNDFEKGIKVKVIQRIELEKDAIKRYYEWQDIAIKNNWAPIDFFARIVEWPKENMPGKIEYYLGAGAQMRPHLDYYDPPKFIDPLYGRIQTEYKASAIFFTKFDTWSLPKNWFADMFPYISENWENYANMTLSGALAKTKRELIERFIEINLPLGVKISKEFSMVVLLAIIFFLTIILVFDTRFAADFAQFCRGRWQCEQSFISPWWGSRNWRLRAPLLILTVLLLPATATWWLLYEFLVLGDKYSIILFILCFFIYSLFAKFILKRTSDISWLNFS